VYRTLYPQASFLASAAEDIGARAKVPFFKGAVLSDRVLATLLARFHKRLAQGAPQAERDWLLLKTLAHLITRHADPQVTPKPMGKERPAVKKVREYMEANFADDVSLSKIAGVVSLSPFYFARAFEKEVGLPPHAYLESVRIRKVRGFLDHGETLVSAALAAGYSDQSHFTRRFKRFMGITPGQYVQQSKF
jgi:AraC-like DNA-binding protein